MSTNKDLLRIFDINGLFCNTISNYEFREDQLKMANNIFDCFSENSTIAIEAGTGTGKSFAYLVPAILKALDNPKNRTIIATSTINLQHQILESDIPTIFKALGKKCNVSLAVGRNNYLCKKKLSTNIEENSLLEQNRIGPYKALSDFALSSKTGLKSDFSGKNNLNEWEKNCSDADFCLGNKCNFFDKCFYQKAKQKVFSSSVIICNHSLLFVDCAYRYKNDFDYSEDCILPSFKNLVIDEAHNIEKNATTFFTSKFSSFILKKQIDNVYKKSTVSELSLLDKLQQFCSDTELYTEITEQIMLIQTQADNFNMQLLKIMDLNNYSTFLFTQDNARTILNETLQNANQLYENCTKLILNLQKYSEIIKKNLNNDFLKEDLESNIIKIKQIINNLSAYINMKDFDEKVYYLELNSFKRSKTVEFLISPLDIASILREALFNKVPSTVCTSATIDLNDNFSYWSNTIGLPATQKNFSGYVYKSHFNYKKNLLLLIPYDSLCFNPQSSESEYENFLTEQIFKAVSSSSGGALVLFTNIKTMENIYKNLKTQLKALNINSFLQGEDDRYRLLKAFKDDEDSVLFATDSFWEGIDVPGNALRLVIITKLPFKMPDEPIFKARYAKLEKNGKNGFVCYSLPDATMKLKQGFGRLIRNTEDRGIVLILDSRIVNKSYGKAMLSGLPESYKLETSIDSFQTKIENFLYS